MNSKAQKFQPFLLNLIKPISPRLIAQAFEQKEMAESTYDPVTQTSDSAMLSDGTSLTYRDTFFGSDTEQCDT